jgi:hypothetical protein
VLKAIRNLFLLIVVFGLIGGGVYLYWNLDLRWRPHEITKDQAEIGKVLEGSGWVSPHLTGPKLYMIAYRSNPASQRFIDSNFTALHGASVDTRVIMVARPDENGAPKSTAPERATVAELGVNRSWALFQKWMAASPDDWTAAGIPAADGDNVRSAVVEVGAAEIDKLTPLLKDNGVGFDYPLLVWWTKDGKMEACACTDAHQYSYVLKDLGAG